ncbi:universal stress protein [Actinoallomurus bryophytorum]|nr:universal stress protein [Actinoallomurus bryophytorum]
MNAIIVGADGSRHSLGAVGWAAEEAALRRSPLRVVHAVPPWLYDRNVDPRLVSVREWLLAGGQEAIGEAVETARARVGGEVDVAGEVVPGGAARTLLERAREASMVVVGSHGVGTVAGLLLGSTALQVVAHTRVPAVVVRHVEPVLRQEIAVGFDAPPAGDSTLAFAFEEAAMRRARLRAVHVWSDPGTGLGGMTPLVYDPEQIAEEQTHRLNEVLAPWRDKYPEVQVVIEIVHGRPVRILAGVSARADLLVVGTRGLGGFTGLMLGSVSHGLLHHAHCPLAVVPPPG